MTPSHHCPACKSTNIIEYEEYIECPKCNLDFFEDVDEEIDDENRLSVQELRGFVKSFKELEDEETRKRLKHSLKKDLRRINKKK